MLAMLSPSALPLSRTSSISSVSSDDSSMAGANGSRNLFVNVSVDGTVKRTRKRFTSQQLMMLEHLYHEASHPTREQREQVAKEAEIDIRSVTVWFQNKRQTDRRLHRQLSETSSPAPVPPSSPFSDASGNTIHTAYSTASTASTPSASATWSRKRDRNRESDAHMAGASGRLVRHRLSRNISLDDIAARKERPVLLPRTPPQCTASSPLPPARPKTPIDREDRDANERALWENMPSSPAAPEPAPRVEKTLVRYVSKRYALEYACAREIVGVRGSASSRMRDEHHKEREKGRSRRHQLGRDSRSTSGVVGEQQTVGDASLAHVRTAELRKEIPVAEWDTHGDTDTEGCHSETPMTPSSSSGFGELSCDKGLETSASPDGPDLRKKAGGDDLIDVAYVLCGLSQRR